MSNTMRFILVYLLLTGYGYFVYSQTKNTEYFSINGKFFGTGTHVITCSYRNAKDKWITSNCNIVNGRFSLKGSVNGATNMWLASESASGSSDDPNWVEVLIEPGIIEVVLKENEYKLIEIKGSSIWEKYLSLEKSKLPILKQLQPLNDYLNLLNDSIRSASKLNDSSKVAQLFENRKAVFDQMAPYKHELNQIETRYVAEHPNDYLSAFLLEKQYMVYGLDKDTAKMYYNNFSAPVQNSYWIKSVIMDINRKEGSAIGATAKNFVAKDINGKEISLVTFKSKSVVILDFWASWCVPCREAIPHLKLCYNKYQASGIAMIAISEDKDKAAWLKAISTDGTGNWNHVLADEDAKDVSNIGMKYETAPIPMCYLINKQGIIIGKWLGNSKENEEAIDKKLQDIFGF